MRVDSVQPGEPSANRVQTASSRPAPPLSFRAEKSSASPSPDPPLEVQMQWDDGSGVVLKFTDKDSGQVVRQIPSEQVLNVVRYIRQLLDRQGQEQQALSSREANHV